MPTVYAAFSSYQAVAAAVEQLQSFGFSKSAIRDESDANFRDPPAALKRETGILSTVENFFAKLRNSPESLPLGLYEQTIRMGGAVLAVDTDTAIEEQTARVLLRNAGSIDAASYSERHGTPASMEAAYKSPDSPDLTDIEASDRGVAVGGLPVHKLTTTEAVVPPGAIASEADFKCFQSGSFEIRQQVEVIRLTKVARVVEELSVNKSVTVYTETINDTLRGTAVELLHVPASLQSADARSPRTQE